LSLGNFGTLKDIGSSDVSDILDQLNVKGVISGVYPTFPGSRVLGPGFSVSVKVRMRTKKALREGLFTAVRSSRIVDVLVISSESPTYSIWEE
jgi:hypothetical protein